MATLFKIHHWKLQTKELGPSSNIIHQCHEVLLLNAAVRIRIATKGPDVYTVSCCVLFSVLFAFMLFTVASISLSSAIQNRDAKNWWPVVGILYGAMAFMCFVSGALYLFFIRAWFDSFPTILLYANCMSYVVCRVVLQEVVCCIIWPCLWRIRELYARSCYGTSIWLLVM